MKKLTMGIVVVFLLLLNSCGVVAPSIVSGLAGDAVVKLGRMFVDKTVEIVGRALQKTPTSSSYSSSFSSKNLPSNDTAKFKISLALQLPNADWVKHTQGSNYSSEAKVRIHSSVYDSGYLYIYSEDSVGSPIEELVYVSKPDNFFQNGETTTLPSGEGYEDFFKLTQKGFTKETLHILYSKTRLNIPRRVSNMAEIFNELGNNSQQNSANVSVNKALFHVPKISIPLFATSNSSNVENKEINCSDDMCQVKLEFSHR